MRHKGTCGARKREVQTMASLFGKRDLRRALILCGIVGSWLVAINQGSGILAGSFDSLLYFRVFLDFATPFTVSSLTAIMRNRANSRAGRRSRL